MSDPLITEVRDILRSYPPDLFPEEVSDQFSQGRNQVLLLIRKRLGFALAHTQQRWSMSELDELCKGFGFATSDSAQSTVRDFLEYIAERQGDQERYERQLEREWPNVERLTDDDYHKGRGMETK